MYKIAISQPTYLPWLGFFKMIDSVDAFVFLDNVQFQKQSWQSRNKIKNNQDTPIWLSVPIKSHTLKENILDIKIDLSKKNWQRKHLNSVKACLGKTPFSNSVIDLINNSFAKNFTNLVDLNIDLITNVANEFYLTTQFYRASELGVSGTRTNLLLDIIKTLNADAYLANSGSKVYLQNEELRFKEENIKLTYHEWTPPSYNQRGNEFIDKLAWVDPVSYLGFNKNILLK